MIEFNITNGVLTGYKADKDVREITVPEGVTEIGEEAFMGSRIISIDIPYVVKEIKSETFDSCDKMQRITIPDSVEKIGDNVFSYCYALEEINLPDSIKTIGEFAFSNCKSLKKVRLPKNIGAITESMFIRCYSLKDLSFLDGIEVIASYAFENCTSLTEVKLPDSIKCIGHSAFSDCTALTDMYVPDSVIEISCHVWENCINLRHIRLSDNIPYASADVFRECKSLEEVRLPKACTWTGCDTFKDSGVKRITVSENMEQCLTLSLGSEIKELVVEGSKGTLVLYERLPYFQHERSQSFFECVRNPKKLDRFFKNDDYMAKEKIPLALYHIGNRHANKYIRKSLEQVTGYCIIHNETENLHRLAENRFISQKKLSDVLEQAELISKKG